LFFSSSTSSHGRGGVGASPFPCATDYRGPSAASEPETQAIQNFVKSLPNRSGAIDFHSFGLTFSQKKKKIDHQR